MCLEVSRKKYYWLRETYKYLIFSVYLEATHKISLPKQIEMNFIFGLMDNIKNIFISHTKIFANATQSRTIYLTLYMIFSRVGPDIRPFLISGWILDIETIRIPDIRLILMPDIR